MFKIVSVRYFWLLTLLALALAACSGAATSLPALPSATSVLLVPTATSEPVSTATQVILLSTSTLAAKPSEALTPTSLATAWHPAPPKELCTPADGRSCTVLLVLPHLYYAEHADPIPGQFERAGYQVVIGSMAFNEVQACTSSGSPLPEPGLSVDVWLKDVQVADYAAIVFVGGLGCQDQWKDKETHRVVRDAVAQGKVLGAVGCAPTILAHAGVMQGKKAAICSKKPPVKQGKDYCEVLQSLGAICVNETLVRDGLIVTAKPGLPYFASAIIQVINEVQ